MAVTLANVEVYVHRVADLVHVGEQQPKILSTRGHKSTEGFFLRRSDTHNPP